MTGAESEEQGLAEENGSYFKANCNSVTVVYLSLKDHHKI